MLAGQPSLTSARQLERRLAEREGFEPSVGFPLHTLSKRAPSTTRTSLRLSGINSLQRMHSSKNPTCVVDLCRDTFSALFRSIALLGASVPPAAAAHRDHRAPSV